MDSWGYWLNESIYTDDGVYNIMKRKHALLDFCQHGLIPFLESAGYKLRFPEGEFYKVFLRLMFGLSKGHMIKPVINDCQYYEDQYDWFSYKLDTERWQKFWDIWGSLEDFSKDKYAYRLQFELAEFVWSWIDIDVSPSAIELYRELEEMEYQEEVTKAKDDPYLQETARREYQDRHWH
jgi:hypothetical protein